MKIPKTDTLILFAFLGCVGLWAVSKCNGRRADLVGRVRDSGTEESEDRPSRRDSVVLHPSTNPAQPVVTPQPMPVQSPPMGPSPTPSLQPGNKPSRPTVQSTPSPTPVAANQSPTPSTATKPKATNSETKPKDSGNTLYVTIDGLKLRKTPDLKGEVITTLELYEAVNFMGKKSEKPEEISLGYEKVTDYWVKVRTKSGKDGWVFGAGVHYYKMKRKGVMEK